MSDFNQYQVDHEVSSKIMDLLQKCAGNDPNHRLVAYDRMKEILDYEIKNEQNRAHEAAGRVFAAGPHCPVCGGPVSCNCIEMLEHII